MGFLRRLFGPKKKTADSISSSNRHQHWSLIRSLNNKTRLAIPNAATPYGDLDANKHAIAVAAATAAVAEAALAAAQAAAEVVRLTSGGGGTRRAASRVQARGTVAALSVEVLAVLKIQSAFRGYLARRALRALKALVKLQALVRGHIVRKQMADMLRRMQTLVRLQARARASRSYTSVSAVSSTKSSLSQHPSVLNATFGDNIDIDGAKIGSNWLDHWMEESTWNSNSHGFSQARTRQDDERSTKILEVDTWKPHINSQPNRGAIYPLQHLIDQDYAKKSLTAFDSPSKYSSNAPNPDPSLYSEEVLSMRSLNFPKGKDENIRSVENSPQVAVSASSNRPGSSSTARKAGPFTPTRSEYSWSYFNGYSGHPNYMANTESSRAKVRSQSAPRQRLEFDKYGSTKRSLQSSWDGGSIANSETSYLSRHASSNLQ